MKPLIGNKELQARLGRSYNIFVLDSNNKAQEFVLNLCHRRDVVESKMRATPAWTTVVFEEDESLVEKPRVFKGEQSLSGFDVTIIFVYSINLSGYSVTWNDSQNLTIETIKEFLRRSSFLDHILVLSSFPYEREDLIGKYIPELMSLPHSLSIGVLRGSGHYGATDLISPQKVITMTVDKYKRWYGRNNVFVSEIEVGSNNENSKGHSAITSFLRLLHPSVRYRSYIGNSFIVELKKTNSSLKQWDVIWSTVFVPTELANAQRDEIREKASQFIAFFDEYHLSEICPKWEHIVEDCVQKNCIEQIGSELKRYFQFTIDKLIRQCEKFLSPS